VAEEQPIPAISSNTLNHSLCCCHRNCLDMSAIGTLILSWHLNWQRQHKPTDYIGLIAGVSPGEEESMRCFVWAREYSMPHQLLVA
jgi:hypothetical protein